MKFFMHTIGFIVVSMVMVACGSGGGDSSSSSTPITEDIPVLTLDKINNHSVTEYFAPFEVQTQLTQTDTSPYHFYVESSNTNLIQATVTDRGVITVSSASGEAGTGESNVTVVVFTLTDVASQSFMVEVTPASFSGFDPLSFNIVDDATWDEVAVRKVLNTFAYGGHATDAQIVTWADMSPKAAIVQIMTFDAQNLLLSPKEDTLPDSTSLETLAIFWQTDNSNNFLDESQRRYFETDRWDAPANAWALASMTRGLNPFLHRVGLWETNYHMAANQLAGVYPLPMLHHYDNIVNALSQNSTYKSVIAQGAKNAAIAYQYGHRYNIFTDGIFRGNEDFAREFHQLFLGILGEYDPEYHELVTIPNTARALTDMQAHWYPTEEGGPDVEITFGTEQHYSGDLDILKSTISGADASVKIDAIASVGIVHEESLKNLPVTIIEHFADNNLNEEAKTRIRESWRGMESKYLLTFLQAYAISTDFHNPLRVKYANSIQRTVRVSNLMIVDNEDNSYRFYTPLSRLSEEDIFLFRPTHDVFGHQTSVEAADSSDVFRVNYNRSVKRSYIYTRNYYCEEDASGSCPRDENDVKIGVWEKDWAKKIPADSNGDYLVEDVALWLWNHFIGDGGKNYGVLERAHIVALLNGKDLGLFIDEEKPLEVYSLSDLSDNITLIQLIRDGSIAKMDLESSDISDRRRANRRVGLAIAFIVATPYIYVQEGR